MVREGLVQFTVSALCQLRAATCIMSTEETRDVTAVPSVKSTHSASPWLLLLQHALDFPFHHTRCAVSLGSSCCTVPWGCYADSQMGQGRNLFAELCLCVRVCVHMHALYEFFSLQLWKKHLALCSGHHSFALLLECVIRAMKIYISNYKQEQAQLQGSISEYLLSTKNNLEAFLFVSVNI